MNFEETIRSQQPILTEGAMVERVRRNPGIELDPHIAHAGLIYSENGCQVLTELYRQYLSIGQRHDLPMLSLAPSWRANPERIAQSGHIHTVAEMNRDCVVFLKEIRDSYGDYGKKVYLAGMLGCRGDAYDPREALGEMEAIRFHEPQITALANSGVDFIKAATLPAVSEAIGIARAIGQTGLPAVLSFVIRPDGTILDGTPLHMAVAQIDAAVDPPPAFYMVNCVHPEVFMSALGIEADLSENVARRVIGFQANTSAKSPEELDNLDYLDTTEPALFAKMIMEIHKTFGTRVLGGCCGTDDSHLEAIARQLAGK